MLKTALKLGRSGGGALLTVAALSLSGCDSVLTGGGGGGDVIARGLRYSTWRERTFEKSLSPSVLKLAGRLDSSPEQSVADRPEGWAVLDLVNAPSLNLGPLSPEEAILINALVPGQHEIAAPVSPMMRVTCPSKLKSAPSG